jgi:Fibronectin type III domain
VVLLAAHTAAAQVTLTWNPSPSAGVDRYLLYYGTQSGVYTTSLDVGLATNTTVTGLSSGQTYYFVITAYDDNTGTESARSNEVSTTLPPSGSPPPTPPPSGSPAPGGLITLEAEAMILSGYLVESNSSASGGALISRRGASGALGVATKAFPGPAGTYQIIVWYFDENDGQSTLTLRVKGSFVGTWTADADLQDSIASAVTLTSHVVHPGFLLNTGDIIALEGIEDDGEYARVDKVEFVPVSGTPPPTSSGVEVIVDDQDTTATQRTGIWNVSSGADPWEGESLFSATVNATFRWTPSLPASRTYQVYAWWTYRSSRSTTVPYQIRHQTATVTVTVNQNDAALGGRWNLLGTFPFAAGSGGSVTVSGENGNACADAVRFVKQ